MSIFAKAVNGYDNPNLPFNLDDPHQCPNLAFFDFAARPRDVWFRSMCTLFPVPKKNDPERGITDAKAYRKMRDDFVNTWIDRLIARGPRVKRWFLEHSDAAQITDPSELQFLEVLPNGFIRRGFVGTIVHVAEPTDETGEDLSDISITQVDWTRDPTIAENLREKWRLARRADITVGQLEELLGKKVS
jgi:hypothetical protein